ncbi:MAG: CheR family methyltransferase [Polyangiaceae bacterium]
MTRTASYESELHPISDEEFALLTALLRERTGISLSPGKKPLLAARLLDRMKALGLRSFADYHRRVLADGSGELSRMTDALCTHETRFFRDAEQLDHIEKSVLPAWLARAEQSGGAKRLRVWSAGCSTGEEPLTIAMLLLSKVPVERGIAIEVLGTDISNTAIERARAARFPEHRMAEIPEEHRRRFFNIDPETGEHTPSRELRSVVRFHRLNLCDWYYPVTGKFDLLLCRNVLIYLDPEMRRAAARRMVERLAPKGVLFLGMTESLLALRDPSAPRKGVAEEVAAGLPPVAAVGPAAYAFHKPRVLRRRF